jgi:hypothetical protein
MKIYTPWFHRTAKYHHSVSISMNIISILSVYTLFRLSLHVNLKVCITFLGHSIYADLKCIIFLGHPVYANLKCVYIFGTLYMTILSVCTILGHSVYANLQCIYIFGTLDMQILSVYTLLGHCI